MRLAEFEIRICLGTKPKGTAPSSDGEEEDGDGRGARSKQSVASRGRRRRGRSAMGWRWEMSEAFALGMHHASPVTVMTPDAFASKSKRTRK